MSPLNSYFLQGSPSEQRLIQDLINEQLKMYGQDVLYMPRKIVGENTVIKEVTASKFDDSFRIEAYLMNYEGFSGNGDILSKFGVRSSDEINLIISKERYDDFISPLLKLWPETERKIAYRPQEGDLIWFPLDESLFEIKYVEHKKPFYQLNNLYVYELRCERFEYEDEIIDVPEVDPTGIEVNESIKDLGNIYTIEPPTVSISGGGGSGGIATAVINSGVLGIIGISSGGVGYTTTPQVTIQKIFIPSGSGISSNINNAQAEAVVNSNGVVVSVRYSNAGAGYTFTPTISFTDPTATTFGDYDYNEVVTGTRTGTTGYVKSWDSTNRILKVAIVDGTFARGEAIVGVAASYKISTVQTNEFLDAYAENIQIENAADAIVDFSQRNPFGEY